MKPEVLFANKKNQNADLIYCGSIVTFQTLEYETYDMI